MVFYVEVSIEKVIIWWHSQPQTCQTPDTSNLRHIKPWTKNIGLPTTQQIKIPFHISIEILFENLKIKRIFTWNIKRCFYLLCSWQPYILRCVWGLMCLRFDVSGVWHVWGCEWHQERTCLHSGLGTSSSVSIHNCALNTLKLHQNFISWLKSYSKTFREHIYMRPYQIIFPGYRHLFIIHIRSHTVCQLFINIRNPFFTWLSDSSS